MGVARIREEEDLEYWKEELRESEMWEEEERRRRRKEKPPPPPPPPPGP